MRWWVPIVAAGVWFLAERVLPLRAPVYSLRERLPSNAVLTTLTAGAAALTARLVGYALARRGPRGLASWFPAPWRSLVALLGLDLFLWLWHRANHEVPLLWRFHAVHHLDPDLDVTTAFRFHPGEIVLAVSERALAVLLVGPTPGELRLYDALFVPAVLFHHGNVRIPLDGWLAKVLVTPALHGIHHDRRVRANYGTLLTLWDRLAGTLVEDLPQEVLEIGAPGYGRTSELGPALRLPLSPPVE